MYLVLSLILTSCSTITKSTFLGIGSGLAVGAADGALTSKDNRSQGALTSAIIVGIFGGVAGYLGHQELENRDTDVRKETLFNLEKFGVSGFSNNFKSKDGDKW